MTSFNTLGRFVVLALVLTSSNLFAQDYYVNYWMTTWKESGRLTPEQAETLAARLKNLGAETRIIDVGVNRPSNPVYPDPNDVYVIKKVQFRLKSPKAFPHWSESYAESRKRTLAGLGFDVQITEYKPLDEVPEAKGIMIHLASSNSFTGTIFQQDHRMPAQLELTNNGGELSGTLSFTFQKYDIYNRNTEKRSYRALVSGRLEGDTVVLETTKALQGRVYIGTVYTLKLSKSGTLSGEWDNSTANIAGRISLTPSR